MTTDGKKLQYLAVKKLTVLLTGVASKNVGDFYCLNCFHPYSKEKKLEKHYNVCKNYYVMIIFIQKCLKKIIKY